jgi:hypothetical protein
MARGWDGLRRRLRSGHHGTDAFVGNDSRGGHLGAAGGGLYGKRRVRIGWGLLKNSRRAADKADSESVMVLTSSQKQALKLLADAVDGCTMPVMLSHGCSVDELRDLAHRRLTVTDRVRQPGTLRTPTVIRVRISDAGRKALARQDGPTNRRKISVRLAILVLFVVGTLAGMGVGALLARH